MWQVKQPQGRWTLHPVVNGDFALSINTITYNKRLIEVVKSKRRKP